MTLPRTPEYFEQFPNMKCVFSPMVICPMEAHRATGPAAQKEPINSVVNTGSFCTLYVLISQNYCPITPRRRFRNNVGSNRLCFSDKI